MKYPSIRTVESVIKDAQENQCGLPDGRWVPARSEGYASFLHRLKATWLVFTGRADAITYPGQ